MSKSLIQLLLLNLILIIWLEKLIREGFIWRVSVATLLCAHKLVEIHLLAPESGRLDLVRLELANSLVGGRDADSAHVWRI